MTHYENIPFDIFIDSVRQGVHDPYEVLAHFAADIKKTEKANPVRVKVSSSRKFLRFCKIKTDAEEFREQVRLIVKYMKSDYVFWLDSDVKPSNDVLIRLFCLIDSGIADMAGGVVHQPPRSL